MDSRQSQGKLRKGIYATTMNKNISNDPCNPKDRDCELGGKCKFQCTNRTWDDETYECEKCKDYYKIYEDDLK